MERKERCKAAKWKTSRTSKPSVQTRTACVSNAKFFSETDAGTTLNGIEYGVDLLTSQVVSGSPFSCDIVDGEPDFHPVRCMAIKYMPTNVSNLSIYRYRHALPLTVLLNAQVEFIFCPDIIASYYQIFKCKII